MPTRSRAAAVFLTAASLALAGCGKKGPMDFPPGTQTEKVTTPDGKTVEKPKKPTRPFVLDGLLN